MAYFYRFIIVLSFSIPLSACSQQTDQKEIEIVEQDTIDTVTFNSIYNPPFYEQFHNQWVTLSVGLNYIEVDAPRKSNINDSKISILKINPKYFNFKMLSASQFDSSRTCVVNWAEKFNLNVVINAGMYNLDNPLSSEGFLKNNEAYTNNSEFRKGYNMAIAFNPYNEKLTPFDIFDLKSTDFNYVKKNYASISQGLRMIDNNGKPLSWNKNPMRCSQLIVAKDNQGFIYFIFTRSPYSHNEMINFMVNYEIPLKNAIYMEGGPQTSLFVNTENYRIEKLGSYVSRTYPTDENNEHAPLPNIIGLIKKSDS